MSRRRKNPSPSESSQGSDGKARKPLTRPEIVRRVLLGGVTVLLVARPLVLGEDPGLTTSRLSDTSSMVLTALWLALGVGWGVWRAMSTEEGKRAGVVEVALLAVVGIILASSLWAASYKHAAWLVTWEWAVFLLAFGMVLRLCRDPDDGHRLLAAILAMGICISGYAIFQYVIEFPALRTAYQSDPKKLQADLARQGIQMGADDPSLAHWLERIQASNVYATFAHPNAFAGYLALLFPVALGWFIAAWRRLGWHWRTLLSGCCAALMGTALALTHSRGAIFGTILVLGAILVARGILSLRRQRLVLAVTMLAAFAGGWYAWQSTGAAGLDRARHSMDLRFGYWSATWDMITEKVGASRGLSPRAQPFGATLQRIVHGATDRPHLWLGVGPGNFSRCYPRYMSASASEKVTDPHNWFLELWATSGIFAAVVLSVAFVALSWKTASGWLPFFSRAAPPAGAPEDTEAALGNRPRWEFYLGGMGGLILGFVLWAAGRQGEQILLGGLVAGVGAVAWFGIFALLEGIPWWGAGRSLALAAGLAALLLNLLVSGGVSLPSVAQPFWVMAALACASSVEPVRRRKAARPLIRFLSLPVLAAACLVYVLLFLIPVTRGHYFLDVAHANASLWQDRWKDELEREPKKKDAHSSAAAAEAALRARNSLQQSVIRPLRLATEQDPSDASPWLDLALWYAEEWRLDRMQGSDAKARVCIDTATALDPENKDCYLARYEAGRRLSKPESPKSHAAVQMAVEGLLQAVKRDPTEARLHFQLAALWMEAKDIGGGLAQARMARDLDNFSTDPARKLTRPERQQVSRWLAIIPPTDGRAARPGNLGHR